jgi:hypothetical protein
VVLAIGGLVWLILLIILVLLVLGFFFGRGRW